MADRLRDILEFVKIIFMKSECLCNPRPLRALRVQEQQPMSVVIGSSLSEVYLEGWGDLVSGLITRISGSVIWHFMVHRGYKLKASRYLYLDVSVTHSSPQP